jgi:hypothetical protein
MVTLPCVFRKTHGKVTKTNSQNSAFAVRLWRRTANVPFIAVRFLESARQTGLFAVRFMAGARQSLFHAV